MRVNGREFDDQIEERLVTIIRLFKPILTFLMGETATVYLQ